MPEPKYEHDCDQCTFLGTEKIVVGPMESTFDMYACEKEKYIEYIARYSSDGPDYICVPSSVTDVKIQPAIRLCQLLYKIHKLENPK